MTDPFDALREPVVAADPDPGFAATLRARLERALALPRGVSMIDTTDPAAGTREPTGPDREPAGTRAPARPEPEPAGVAEPAARLGAAVPYLAVPAGAGRRALDWYAEVLGARLVGQPVLMPDGALGHAELAVGGGLLYLAEEFPDLGVVAPTPAGTPVTLVLPVADAAGTARRGVERGARMPRPVREDHGSRTATLVDPFGHRWLLRTPLPDRPAPGRPGRVGYAWLSAPDPDRAADFYAAVLGWEYRPGDVPGGRNVEGRSTPLGIGGGEPGFHLSFAVDDVPAAVERVRAAGGTAGDPADRAYGPAADCTDDQGVPFTLHRAGPGAGPPAPGPGDLSYLTLRAADPARARAFYGSVLGWEFEPGPAADGWQVPAVSPMTGLHGGAAGYPAVPMWKVDDVPAAVERVRAAGGTAADPERMPYGTTAECTDDQGNRFHLGDA